MPLTMSVPVPGQTIETINAGDYVAACVGVIELGTQKTDYKGEVKEPFQVALVFELDEEKSDGSRHLVIERFTASLNERAGLRLMLEKWSRGKLNVGQSFDLRSILGKSFQVDIVNESVGDRTYHKIAKAGIGPLGRKETPIPAEEQREHIVYEIGDPIPDLSGLPYLYGRPIGDVIREAKEMAGKAAPAASKPAPPKLPGVDENERQLYLGLMDRHAAGAKGLASTDPKRKDAARRCQEIKDQFGFGDADLPAEVVDLLDDCPF